MSHARPTYKELLEAYFGPYDDSYGDPENYVVEESDFGDGYVFAYDSGDGVIYHEPESNRMAKLADHLYCSVGIAAEGDEDDPDALSIMCFDCDEVIYDVERD